MVVLLALLISESGLFGAFEINGGDRIVLIGNSLAERMQHDGWLESMLHHQYPEHQLMIRNLGFPGDSVNLRPRSVGSPSLEDYVRLCRADVIFMMFGYNESFAGAAGSEKFEDDLRRLIDSFKEEKPNGHTEPRIVLFSPIAHEDLGIDGLTDGKENNERLAIYRDSIRKVAESEDCRFVDLFEVTAEFYGESEEALTINGVHLNTFGNRRVAEWILEAISGEPRSVSSNLQSVMEAVLEKNLYWFNRYRATNGNDIWGERSQVEYVDGQTNADVLNRELIMFDVLAQNRDKQIWARATGGDLQPDDSNVPRSIEVETNIGFWVKSENEESEGSLNYQSGREGLKDIDVLDGFEVNLFADESMFPELVNPVQMAVDPAGRLWASVWPNYPRWNPDSEMRDAILVFPDDDRDGVADRAVTFATVPNPTAFEFWNGGVLVASQPDIWFLKDTDGDDVADEKAIILNGIGSADTHHGASSFVYGPDGGLYWQSGVFLVNHIESPGGSPLLVSESGVFRFDPRRFNVQFLVPYGVNPHGVSFDRWGYQYGSDATSGEIYQVLSDDEGFRMSWMLERSVRPVSSSGIVSSANFPPSMQQNYLICNTIGFLGIKLNELDRDGAQPTFIEGPFWNRKVETEVFEHGEIWGEEKADLLVSDDKNFRPSDIEFGSDGALYIADWHNVIIGHVQHNVRDPNRDQRHGRIYRMTYKDRPLQEPVEIAGASLDQLMLNLEHPIDGVRYRTRIELSKHGTAEVMEACERWMQKFDITLLEDSHPLLEALWIHQRRDVHNHELLHGLLQSPDLHVRNAAKRVQLSLGLLATSGRKHELEDPEERSVQLPSGVVSDSGDTVQVRIGTVRDKMLYDVTEFRVERGKLIELTFFNPDFMPHNIVFVAPDSADDVAGLALQMGADGFLKGFVPEDDRIIAASALVDYGEEEQLVFQAPETPGRYEFVCTFPGHHLLMRGVMIVE